MLHIRRFRPDADLKEVMGLVASVINEPYKPELFLNAYSSFPDGFLVVEELNLKRIVGCVVSIITPEDALRILILAVAKEWQNRGIGTMLMKRIFRIAALNGARKVTLEVRVDNIRAQEFYTRLGFVRVGIIKNYYVDGADGYVMEKPVF